jgi:hypothetical protein
MLGHHIRFYLPIRTKEVRGAGGRGKTMGEKSTDRRYEIRLQGHLQSRWAAWFDGMTLTTSSDGTTVIHGLVADQAALHGLLQKVRDMGLPLVSVSQTDRD